MYKRIRGGVGVIAEAAGFRQDEGRGPVVGKDMLYVRAEWGSDAFGRLLCG